MKISREDKLKETINGIFNHYSNYGATNRLKRDLIEFGYKEHKCEKCGKTEFMGEEIPVELHHMDGDRNNNSLDNLQILCPNCHALTDNFRWTKRLK